MALCRVFLSVACQYFSVTGEFLYSLILAMQLTFQPTFNGLTTRRLTRPTRHSHPPWTGKRMVTLRHTCTATRPLMRPRRKERAASSREDK
jgi:hypothetical protein